MLLKQLLHLFTFALAIQEARVRFLSEEGVRLLKKQNIELESIFGQIKKNNGFKSFLLGGLNKFIPKFGLSTNVHNIRKWTLV